MKLVVFPIDIAFASLGFATRFGRVSQVVKLETIAATLMHCGGLMAISFWAITGDCSPIWWAMNLWLIGLGVANLFWGSQNAVSDNCMKDG